MYASLHAVDFVLFTQPKTGTHLLIPILTELTGKDVYWAKEYTGRVEPIQENYQEAFQNREYIFFSANLTPWKRETMDRVWRANQQHGTFLHLHAPYSVVMEEYLSEKKCINFFIKRDPRDEIISLLNHYKYIHFEDSEMKAIPSDDERLLCMIRKRLRTETLQFMGWLNSPICCVLEFSKLMGKHGGVFTDMDAMEEMQKMLL